MCGALLPGESSNTRVLSLIRLTPNGSSNERQAQIEMSSTRLALRGTTELGFTYSGKENEMTVYTDTSLLACKESRSTSE